LRASHNIHRYTNTYTRLLFHSFWFLCCLFILPFFGIPLRFVWGSLAGFPGSSFCDFWAPVQCRSRISTKTQTWGQKAQVEIQIHLEGRRLVSEITSLDLKKTAFHWKYLFNLLFNLNRK